MAQRQWTQGSRKGTRSESDIHLVFAAGHAGCTLRHSILLHHPEVSRHVPSPPLHKPLRNRLRQLEELAPH